MGDFIEAQGTVGIVDGIQIFHTILKTVDNKVVYLPNGALSSGNITNYSQQPLRRVDLTVSVEYGQDIDQVKQVLSEVFSADERILTDPAPFVALSQLAESSVNLTVRLWVKAPDYWGVFFDTQERIYAEFNRQGISFPFPQITIHQA